MQHIMGRPNTVSPRQVMSPRFTHYAKQVKKNCHAMAEALVSKGYTLATGGTDNHLILWDLKPQDISGNKFETLADLCNITVNKNAINGDTSAFTPGGVRVGTPALTSRGLNEEHFVTVAHFLSRVVEICVAAQKTAGNKKMVDFEKVISEDATTKASIAALRAEVEAFATQFPMPGVSLPPKA